MKKRILAIGLTMLVLAAMIMGCASGKASKEDYQNDREEFAKLADVSADDMDELLDAIKDLSVKTSEGKAIKKDMEELMEFSGDLLKDFTSLLSMDKNEVDKLQKELDDLTQKVEKDVEEFEDAAKDAGIDADDLKGLTDDLGI